jgi:hypothetical protein
MTCRDEILECVKKVMIQSGLEYFTVQEIVDCMTRQGSRYTESTIRTHVTSRMCANAPDHHAVRYPDVERIEHGKYRPLQSR